MYLPRVGKMSNADDIFMDMANRLNPEVQTKQNKLGMLQDTLDNLMKAAVLLEEDKQLILAEALTQLMEKLGDSDVF